MVASERYERQVFKNLKGADEASEDDLLAKIGAVFSSFLPQIPAVLREDIHAWYVDCHARGDTRFPTLQALALRLGAIMDIFDRAYDAERTPLDDDEWELIRSLTNEYSPDIDLGTLQYVMQLLMDRGDIR